MLSNNFTISIVGRTNVGKSTIFNRLTKTREAIVYNRSSVTRDVKSSECEILGKKCRIQDMPGLFDEIDIDNQELKNKIHKNIEKNISQSNLLLFVVDAISGICQYDYEVANLIRRYNIPIIVVCNKCDSTKIASEIHGESFGFNDVFYLSAEHNIGISDLEIFLHKAITSNDQSKSDPNQETVNISIVGRPNVGKSTMINAIIGKDSQLVADYSGLTRDIAKYKIKFKNHNICIIDTPGIRKQTNISDNLEFISASMAKKTFEYVDVVILMIDASTLESGEINKTDYMLANEIIKNGRSIVIAFNKVDKTPYKHNEIPKFIKRLFAKNLYQLKDVSFLFVSAQNNININKMLSIAIHLNKKQSTKIATSRLNTWLQETIQHEFMQSFGDKFKLKYITQVGTRPMQFLLFGRSIKNMRADHERFIANRFRNAFGIHDVPVKFYFKETRKTTNT